MDDGRIPLSHVAELSRFFAAHDQWLFGHACVRTRGDRELAADLLQDTFEAAARAWTELREQASDRQRAWLLGLIRQAITRAPADRASTARISVRMALAINRLAQARRQLGQDLGRLPTPEELAAALDMTPEQDTEVQEDDSEQLRVRSIARLTWLRASQSRNRPRPGLVKEALIDDRAAVLDPRREQARVPGQVGDRAGERAVVALELAADHVDGREAHLVLVHDERPLNVAGLAIAPADDPGGAPVASVRALALNGGLEVERAASDPAVGQRAALPHVALPGDLDGLGLEREAGRGVGLDEAAVADNIAGGGVRGRHTGSRRNDSERAGNG